MHLLIFILIGLIAGAVAGRIVSGHGYGIVGDIVVGIIGAFLGGWRRACRQRVDRGCGRRHPPLADPAGRAARLRRTTWDRASGGDGPGS